MLQVLVNIFLKVFSIAKRGMWLCKRISIKNGQVSKTLKTMGTQMPAMKKEREKKKKRKGKKKIAHVL
jgi:hypothetical protein